mgnify:CR=1 FL=1
MKKFIFWRLKSDENCSSMKMISNEIYGCRLGSQILQDSNENLFMRIGKKLFLSIILKIIPSLKHKKD